MSLKNLASRIAISIVLAAPVTAWAQNQATAQPGGAAEGAQQQARSGVEDIVVTAQRREERLQEVPISITAIGAESLERSGISNTAELTQSVPSLVFSRVNTSFQPYIRGVGTRNANAGEESSVSVYIDGIYQPVPSSLGMELLGIERVEVLRGPQGTLFGRNATGGLVNIITADPKFDLSGKLVVSAGKYGQRSINFHGTTGLSDKVAIDVAALYSADDGYIRDLVRGGNTGDYNAKSVRGKLLFQPSDSFKAILSGGYSKTRDGAAVSGQPLNRNSIGFFPPGSAVPVIPAQVASLPWEAALDREIYGESEQWSINLQSSLQLSGVTLETTTSYQVSDTLSLTDSDATIAKRSGSIAVLPSHYFSQEVRLLSDDSGPFKWIAGAYYFDGTAKFDPLTALGTNDAVTLSVFSKQDVRSFAGFAEGTYNLTDALRLTLGGRYTTEKRNFVTRPFDAAGVLTVLPPREATYNKFTYRASLQYRFSNSANIYATYSRGFKSGLFNGFASTASATNPVRPETLDAFEIGAKTDLTNWLRVNVSAFHYDYKDIQQSARDPATGLVLLLNAAKAKSDGFEIEATLAPVDGLNVRLYSTYLDAHYVSFPGAQTFTPRAPVGGYINGDVAGLADLVGTDLLRAPRYTFGASFDYTVPLGSGGELGFAGNIFRSAKYYWDSENRLTQPAYTQINAEISWLPKEHIRLSFWAKNLTNAQVYKQMQASTRGDLISYDPPRTLGGRVTLSF
jgi:iron complex outermembrane recepter protein